MKFKLREATWHLPGTNVAGPGCSNQWWQVVRSRDPEDPTRLDIDKSRKKLRAFFEKPESLAFCSESKLAEAAILNRIALASL